MVKQSLHSFLALFVSTVFICLHDNATPVASALSSPSKLGGYHFGSTAANTASSPRKVTAANLRQANRPKPYVPDGLTEEEYAKIKSEELMKQSKMNYGMWGPRFAKINGDPDSNWFNLPSLWTGGYDAARQKYWSNSDTNIENAEDGKKLRVACYLRRYALSYFMLLLSSQLLPIRSFAAKKALSAKWIAARVVLPLVALKPLSLVASFGEKRNLALLEKHGVVKLASIMSAAMLMLGLLLRRTALL